MLHGSASRGVPGCDLSWEETQELQDNCSLLVLAIPHAHPKGPGFWPKIHESLPLGTGRAGSAKQEPAGECQVRNSTPEQTQFL